MRLSKRLLGGRAALIAAGLLSGAATAHAQAAPPDYSGFTAGTFLPFVKAGEGQNPEIPRLEVTIGGRTFRAQVDSGSTGIVIAAKEIPDYARLQSQGDGELTYTSSGRVMHGQWVVTPLTIAGTGAKVDTDPMPVLAVTRVTCLDSMPNCGATEDPARIAILGIGFAREADRQTQSTPDKNPFLHVAGAQRHGWILQHDGVHVGLTAANTQGNFRFIKLMRKRDDSDWRPTPACIALDRRSPPACGRILVDTGVTAMFLTVPPSQAGEQAGSLAAGTEVSILAGSGDTAAPLYSFTVGSDSPLAPSATHLRVAPRRVFVNTGVHLLNGFDVLYDADGGYAAFKQR